MATFGDIVKVVLPPPVSPSGHEQVGFRPAIVVQDSKYNSLPTTIVVPLTSNPAASRFKATFSIKKSSVNGLTEDSIALVFQIRAIDNKRIKSQIGKLSGNELLELKKHLKEIIPN